MHRYLKKRVGGTGVAALVVACLLAACAPQAIRPAGLVNPATSYCHARGGKILLGYTAEGREGLCFLPDGALLDEWQLYRQDHPCE